MYEPDDEVEIAPLVDVVPRLTRRVDEDVGVLGAHRLERLEGRRDEALELLRRPPRVRLEEAHLKSMEGFQLICLCTTYAYVLGCRNKRGQMLRECGFRSRNL